jgi:hypothetical protein
LHDLLGRSQFLFLVLLFDEVGELLEVEEAMLNALFVLLFINEVVSLYLVVTHPLLLVLTH